MIDLVTLSGRREAPRPKNKRLAAFSFLYILDLGKRKRGPEGPVWRVKERRMVISAD